MVARLEGREGAPHAIAVTSDPAHETSELWVWCAYALVLVGLGGLVYLGSHPAGLGPLRVYLTGPPVLACSALAVGLWGLLQALVRRPFLRRGRLAGWFAVGATIALASYPLPFPSRHAGRPGSVRIELPLEGRWRVQWGGEDPERNLPASARPDRRFGYDLLPLDGQGPGAGVSAPCEARVVAVRGRGMSTPAEAHWGYGTHVVLEVAPGEFLFVGWLDPQSLAVSGGERVARGAPLGRLGALTPSPFTSGPHLVLFLQDTPTPLWGQGIPLEFAALSVNGERVERAEPRGASVREPARLPGDVVERAR
jgi:hypothetical protein